MIVRLAGPRESVETVALVDTGASVMMLSRELAERLGHDVADAETIPIHTANGVVEVLHFELTEVAIGEAGVQGVEAVCPVTDDTDRSVLVGLSFLRHFVVTLDFKRGFLVLEDH